MNRGAVELEPEVEPWLNKLPDAQWAQAVMHLDLLEARGVHLGEPYTRQLDGKLRELRFYCGGLRFRVTYWIAPERRIVMLTVFAKTRMKETAEVERARQALRRCRQEGHTMDEECTWHNDPGVPLSPRPGKPAPSPRRSRRSARPYGCASSSARRSAPDVSLSTCPRESSDNALA
ncbi:type II toxin-antitoxin system RelE/ParE family toxin [Streptomyces sp. AV19]|nr:type II toxin-antitoxin system RelE/ParE family toxin [Streptomyces sp. AV19]MBH1935631.1 type II toxin-antitoxin system RelE/ParE family toxin [Streptomyces sp. AV19]MDG4534521.1 type II toxin-antitoxin system RelE/ParE family toxin [Streptomyces sp. AV19]